MRIQESRENYYYNSATKENTNLNKRKLPDLQYIWLSFRFSREYKILICYIDIYDHWVIIIALIKQKQSIVLNLCNTAWTEESYHQYEDMDTFDVLEKYEMDKLSAMFTNLYNEQVHVFVSPVTNVSQTGICIPISKEAS